MKFFLMDKKAFAVFVLLAATTGACTDTPFVPPTGQISDPAATTAGTAIAMKTQTPAISLTPTNTLTPTITLTPTPPPDIEFAQFQVIDFSIIIAEIVNHLDVPVIFEDLKPAFRFDIYDPILDQHWIEEVPVYRTGGAEVPCVLYPGEHAYFLDAGILKDWYLANPDTNPSRLKITYQSLGVPTPDWKNDSTQPKVWDVQWNIKDHVLYFSFKHDPITDIHENNYYWVGNMGLYDKDNHLLSVGRGDIGQTIQTGIADGYWITLDGYTQGDYPSRSWSMASMNDLPDQLDHISIMIELLKKDGICFK